MLSKFALVAALLFNALLVSQQGSSTQLSRAGTLYKRAGTLPAAFRDAYDQPDLCAPLTVPQEEQCAHVKEQCNAHATSLHIPYMRGYFCATLTERPAFGVGLAFWLFFLFSTLGITASDFFCPNLATISSVLGLDEAVAGVTFLAFGNGSPDLFSTFSAMKAGSGDLAIGELVGAASFITSVVVGSLCIIRPFQVPRWSFLRDVGFFTAAILLLLAICLDGKIRLWEAGLLVALYVLYVFVVIVGTWYERRMELRRAREQQVRAEYADEEEDEFVEPYHDEDVHEAALSRPSLQIVTSRPRAISNPGVRPRLLSPAGTIHRHSAMGVPTRMSSSDFLEPTESQLLTPSVAHNIPSFSLLGALEFRDVITALRSQSNESGLDVFEQPSTPQVETRQQRLRRLRSGSSVHRPSRHSSGDSDASPWSSSMGLPLNERHSLDEEQPTLAIAEPSQLPVQPNAKADPANSSTTDVTASSPTLTQPHDDARSIARKAGSVRRSVAHRIYRTLFPSLQNFGSKSWIGRIASVLCVPAVFALTITLPVVVTSDPHAVPEPAISIPDIARNGQLIDIDEDVEAQADDNFGQVTDAAVEELREGLQDVLLAEEEVLESMHGKRYSRWLMAVQCVFGPLLCWVVLLSRTRHAWLLLVGIIVGSIAAAVLVVLFSEKGNDPAARSARMFMGFAIAIVWIMAIADEVVAVLQTFGHMFGLSDAIIGLTIFAVGNSLADFVADLSVAAFAPLMAFAACFGGPMLNILLGVGLSGSYVISESAGEPYPLNFSTTLLVSTVGLLSMLILTMIVVPLKGYRLTRRWGLFLICYYVLLMTTNIIVEIMKL
ncbi:Sodium/calcium exchanger protein-domain-containing protein [Auriculariales sp. MPI-PUGE-AT-0066]|nr:Sodium/calcium exchanger protein-domain-containing protein [Auriculariales sp. MPI-PUGE-AT-0066]